MSGEDGGRELIQEIFVYEMAKAYWLMGIRQGITPPPPPNFEGAYLMDESLNGTDAPNSNFANANLQYTKLVHATEEYKMIRLCFPFYKSTLRGERENFLACQRRTIYVVRYGKRVFEAGEMVLR